MKVLTLKQPWATLVANGLKEYEFRSWKTNYRGKLLIHAGAGIDKEISNFNNLEFPKKRLLAIVELVDCLELNDELNKIITEENSLVYGNKNRTGYAWRLKVIKKINLDKEINGQLGLWNTEEVV